MKLLNFLLPLVLIILLSIIIGILRFLWMKRSQKNKAQRLRKYKDFKSCIDKDFSNKCPDFANRFEIDPWDLRG